MDVGINSYFMNKILFSLLLGISLFSCSNHKQTNLYQEHIEKLQIQNDSLISILNEINNKYVFDSVSIRTIPHFKNTSKVNSIDKNELVFIAYNQNDKSSMLFDDSYDTELNYSDTLRMTKGAFILERKLKRGVNHFSGIAKSKNEYGKGFETSITISVMAE